MLTGTHRQNEPIPEKAFLGQWRKAVGDTFEDTVALPLLSVSFLAFLSVYLFDAHAETAIPQGNYLTSIDALADPATPLLTYFPASALPVDAGARGSLLRRRAFVPVAFSFVFFYVAPPRGLETVFA